MPNSYIVFRISNFLFQNIKTKPGKPIAVEYKINAFQEDHFFFKNIFRKMGTALHPPPLSTEHKVQNIEKIKITRNKAAGAIQKWQVPISPKPLSK